jgi:ankyrin repeat protein
MMLAAEKGHLRVVKILLAAGANPNVRVTTTHAGEVNPLIWAVLSRNKEVVEVLLKAGAVVNPQTFHGEPALMTAVSLGEKEIIKTLLAAGANVNAKMFNGYTALMSAAGNFEPEITTILISAGADPNVENEFGETALSIAIKKENTEV